MENTNNNQINLSDIFEDSEEDNEHFIDDMQPLSNIIIDQPSNQSLKRKRESDDEEEQAIYNERKKRIIKVHKPITNYVRLYSGEELYFNNNSKEYKLILTKYLESNKLIRNIVKRIMINSFKGRIEYLSKFLIKDKEDNDISIKYYVDLRNDVYTAYYREIKLQRIFKKLLNIWRIYRIDKAYVKDIDPITLSEPEKCIIVYDMKNKRKYILDGKSLSNSINASLLYYQNAFASPLNPKNPKTNVEFTYSQLISIYYQLQEKGELKWTISTLKESNFNVYRWNIYNKSILAINAIKNEINKLDTYDGKELLLDFIITKLEEYDMHPTELVTKAYEVGINKVPNHTYLQKLKPIAIIHYEAIQYNLNMSGTIKAACLKIFKGQNKFIRDLIATNVLKVIRRSQQ